MGMAMTEECYRASRFPRFLLVLVAERTHCPLLMCSGGDRLEDVPKHQYDNTVASPHDYSAWGGNNQVTSHAIGHTSLHAASPFSQPLHLMT